MREKLWWYTEESQAMLERGYLLPNQTVEEKIKLISKHAASYYKDVPDLKDKFAEMIERGWCSLSSPIWANFGETDRGYPISCFSSFVADDLDKIYSTLHEVAMMTKLGGGTSGYFGKLRAKGTPIKGGGKSSGMMSFLRLYDATTEEVSQSGVRRGAFAAYLDIEHPEIEEFLRLKDKGHPMQTINTAVNISDEWMKAMEEGDKEKRDIWAKVLKSRREKGIPYLFFKDTANKNKPQIYKDTNSTIYSSNLCVSPNTNILTSEGYKLIGELEDEEVEVWNGEEWSNVFVRKTGENQKLLRVKTKDGYELDCTEYNKFYVQRGYKRGTGKNKLEILEIRAKDLKPDDKLIRFELPIIQGNKTLAHAYDNGFYSGDGCLTNQGQRIYLYHGKQKLIEYFSSVTSWHSDDSQNRTIGHTRLLKDKFFVPSGDYTIESRLKWLSGLLDSDGTVTNNNGSQSLQIASVEKEFLKEIQLMLQTLGCDSKVTIMRNEGSYKLPKNDGSNELGDFNCREAYRLLINGNSLFKLIQLGLECKRLEWSIRKPNRECSQFIKIESVEELPDLSDTFCFTEPKRNMGMFNGILTGNCNEIYLPTSESESFVCCLMSMNLALYDEWKDTDAVELAVMFLDAVMSDFIKKTKDVPYMKRAHDFAVRHRALGLGVLGWHTLLQQRMIPFESFEAQQLNTSIFSNIKKKAYSKSVELGEAYGYAPIFDGVETLDTKRRNTTLLALAPTTSSSSILGQVSPSIEPYASNYFVVGLAKGSFTRRSPELEKLLESKGQNTDEVWRSIIQNQGSVQHLSFLDEREKDVFKTFQEISPMMVIQQAAARQPFIDQGQSINLKIPSAMSIKDINKIHMEAWKLGLKGLYYQRGTSVAKEAVLQMMDCKACGA